jgi:uncharacterized protein with PQ loop repeat
MDILSALYVMVGFVFTIAFIPQLRTLWRDRTGAASVSISTWAMFSACNVITLLYAITHTTDSNFIFCSAMCTLGNLAVFTLALWRRLKKPDFSEISA